MIRIERISFHIGAFRLQNTSLEIATGEYFVLLGPPGSGKSIFLECLCGLKKIDSGKIYIDERDVTFLEPRARNIGYVPQDYALFPHLTVERNIAFGLRVRKHAHKDIVTRVTETADLLGIRHLLSRKINGLSGGETQRVALARAMVLQPKILLLDEPVCALDEVTRQEVCAQLFRIQRHLGVTIIHVSHNLEEAFSVADRAAILHDGILQQVGTLEELLRKPDSEFVARFMRCDNIFYGQVTGPGTPEAGLTPSRASPWQQQQTRVRVGDIELCVPGEHRGKVKLMIRPEDVLIRPNYEGRSKGENEIYVKPVRWRNYGGYIKVELDGPFNLVAHLTDAVYADLKVKQGTDLVAILRSENIHVLPA
jgi:molybdate/tungstate transport system ATP-binding protein